MTEAAAWVVQLEGGFRVAVGEREMIHLVEAPILEAIPQTPLHCQYVLLWEGEILPVMDLTAWLTGRPAILDRISVGIVGWQEEAGVTPQYGALLFNHIPQKVTVDDSQLCDLPESPLGWREIAISCFRHDDQPIPILDVPRLFADILVLD